MRELILNEVTDAIGKLLYYDRKEDENLKLHDIEYSILDGDISILDILLIVETEINKSVEQREFERSITTGSRGDDLWKKRL